MSTFLRKEDNWEILRERVEGSWWRRARVFQERMPTGEEEGTALEEEEGEGGGEEEEEEEEEEEQEEEEEGTEPRQARGEAEGRREEEGEEKRLTDADEMDADGMVTVPGTGGELEPLAYCSTRISL